jgi:hypothetical protein
MPRKTRAQIREERDAEFERRAAAASAAEAAAAAADGRLYRVSTRGFARYYRTLDEARRDRDEVISKHDIPLTTENYFLRQVSCSSFSIGIGHHDGSRWIGLPDEGREITYALRYADEPKGARGR